MQKIENQTNAPKARLSKLQVILITTIFALAVFAGYSLYTSTGPVYNYSHEVLSSVGFYHDEVTWTLSTLPSQDSAAYFASMTYNGWIYAGTSPVSGGWTFVYYTHNVVTNTGLDFLVCITHNVEPTSSGSCKIGQGAGNGGSHPYQQAAQYIDVVQAGANALATTTSDTVCFGGNAGSPVVLSQSGFAEVAAVNGTNWTYANAAATSGTATYTNTYTASTSYNSIQGACILSFPYASGAQATSTTLTTSKYVLYAENIFSSVNVISGDTLALTWTFAYVG